MLFVEWKRARDRLSPENQKVLDVFRAERDPLTVNEALERAGFKNSIQMRGQFGAYVRYDLLRKSGDDKYVASFRLDSAWGRKRAAEGSVPKNGAKSKSQPKPVEPTKAVVKPVKEKHTEKTEVGSAVVSVLETSKGPVAEDLFALAEKVSGKPRADVFLEALERVSGKPREKIAFEMLEWAIKQST